MMSVVDRQSSTGTYGAPLIDGCSWATWVSRCSNLTVYGNGSSFDDSGCGAPNGCTFGPEFQCTELAQRYAYYAWGEPATWDGYARRQWQRGADVAGGTRAARSRCSSSRRVAACRHSAATSSSSGRAGWAATTTATVTSR